MTDISVFTEKFQTEDRSWDLTPPSGGFEIGGTIAVAALTESQHYPNGYVPSGTVFAKATAGTYKDKLVPYLGSGSDGAGTAAGVLKSSVRITRRNGSTPDNVGAALLVHGVVDESKLPLTSTSAANGGYIDSAGKSDLKLIYFTD